MIVIKNYRLQIIYVHLIHISSNKPRQTEITDVIFDDLNMEQKVYYMKCFHRLFVNVNIVRVYHREI